MLSDQSPGFSEEGEDDEGSDCDCHDYPDDPDDEDPALFEDSDEPEDA
jgi:hypothetical protein